MTPRVETFARTIWQRGNPAANEDRFLKPLASGGTITEVAVKPGDVVELGQSLVTLE